MRSIRFAIDDWNATITAATKRPPTTMPIKSKPIGSKDPKTGEADAPTCEIVLDASVKSIMFPEFMKIFVDPNQLPSLAFPSLLCA